MFDEFFSKAHELTERGIPFATATVVRAEKPTSGKAGDKAIITADGTLYGWIGGSCAQPTVIKEALKALAEGEGRFIRLSPDPDKQAPREGVIDLPMTCFSGGTLEIYIEPQFMQPRLLIVGSLPIAQTLAQLGKVMNYHVTAVDLDGQTVSGADKVLLTLDEAVAQVRADTFVVVATHGNYDELALEQILKVKPSYVGLVASQKRFESVLDYLRIQGLSDDELRPLKAPAGLDIQARRGDEIALSIMAEIVQRRRSRREQIDVTTLPSEHTHHHKHHAHESGHHHEHHAESVNVAIDPVCGMEVDIATAQHTYEYNGETYYFCCPGCKRTFSKNPEQYATAAKVAIDPICGMEVEIASAKYTHDYNGETYYFCCAGCKTKFVQNPAQYLAVEVPSGQAIDPVCHMTVEIAKAQYMAEYEGDIYYFCGEGCKLNFEKNPAAYVPVTQA